MERNKTQATEEIVNQEELQLDFVEGVGRESTVYTRRFSETEDSARAETWRILCQDFFQRYISPEDIVIDLGAGDGLFIKNIQAKRRIAVDISEHVRQLNAFEIEIIVTPATALPQVLGDDADIIFMSNFLEHLPAKKLVLDIFDACWQVLKPGGKILILQPNVRYVGAAYWDYIDHHIALTEHSLVEALDITGFQVQELIPRFLPYTMKSRLGTVTATAKGAQDWLVRAYLKMPFFWRFFGQQTFIVGEKRSESSL